MSTHEYDNNMRPDSEFLRGNLSFLVSGNKCRLLDGRRTAGFIEEYDMVKSQERKIFFVALAVKISDRNISLPDWHS